MSAIAAIEAALMGLELAERGAASYARIKAMREQGISDEQILDELQKLKTLLERHQSLDLRD